MADIVHQLRMRAHAHDVFRAVTVEELLRPWWSGDGNLAVDCVEIDDGTRVSWRCVDGPAEWIGTDITFAFACDRGETVVRFSHRNWREPSDAFASCSTKWARILMALKSRMETPEADDLGV